MTLVVTYSDGADERFENVFSFEYNQDTNRLTVYETNKQHERFGVAHLSCSR